MKKHNLLLLFLLPFSCFSSFASNYDDLIRDLGRLKGNVKEVTVEIQNETTHRYYSKEGQLDSMVSPSRHISFTYGETNTLKYKLLKAGAWMEVSANKDSCVTTDYDPISESTHRTIEYLDDKGRTIKKNTSVEFKYSYNSKTRTLTQKGYEKGSPNEVRVITETKYNAKGDVIEIRVINGRTNKLDKCFKYNNDGDMIESEDDEKIKKYSYTKPDAQGNWTECTLTTNGKPLSDDILKMKQLYKEPIRGVRGEYTEELTIKRTIVYY